MLFNDRKIEQIDFGVSRKCCTFASLSEITTEFGPIAQLVRASDS